MSAPKTVSRPRIHIEHPRSPEPSRASLWVGIDWLKSDVMASCEMSESDLYTLAEEALKVAAILRRQRLEA